MVVVGAARPSMDRWKRRHVTMGIGFRENGAVKAKFILLEDANWNMVRLSTRLPLAFSRPSLCRNLFRET